MMKILLSLGLLSLMSCGHMPRIDSKVVKFNNNEKVVAEKNGTTKVQVFESQYQKE
jgi:hypothetical protein